jgi:hypothetical protein
LALTACAERHALLGKDELDDALSEALAEAFEGAASVPHAFKAHNAAYARLELNLAVHLKCQVEKVAAAELILRTDLHACGADVGDAQAQRPVRVLGDSRPNRDAGAKCASALAALPLAVEGNGQARNPIGEEVLNRAKHRVRSVSGDDAEDLNQVTHGQGHEVTITFQRPRQSQMAIA